MLKYVGKQLRIQGCRFNQINGEKDNEGRYI